MKNLILALCAVFVLAACQDQPDAIYVKDNFEVDGCTVKYVNHPRLPNFYIARCGTTTTYSHEYSVGKSRAMTANVVAESSDELRKRLASVEAREKAMSKLSDEEKAVLGVK